MNRDKLAYLIGIFEGLPVGAMNTTYLDRFTQTIFSPTETIKFDEIHNTLEVLGVVPRGSKASEIKVNGFARSSVTPDIISGNARMSVNDITKIQQGQSLTVLKGQTVDNGTAVKARLLQELKTRLERTKVYMANELFLKGEVVLPISNVKIDFGYAEPEAKTFKKANMNWTSFFNDIRNDYMDENGIFPTHVEVDKAIFNEMLQSATFRDQVKAFNSVNLGITNNVPTLNILGTIVSQLVPAFGLDGKPIDTANMVYVSNNSEFTKAYAVLLMAENDRITPFEGEYLLQEIIEKDPVGYLLKIESAFCPIIPIANRVKRYKLTLN